MYDFQQQIPTRHKHLALLRVKLITGITKLPHVESQYRSCMVLQSLWLKPLLSAIYDGIVEGELIPDALTMKPNPDPTRH